MNTNLTPNELRAALILVRVCFKGMGGNRPGDLADDPFTWVDAKDLIEAGYNRHEAAGTFGALMEKGFVMENDKNSWIMTDAAWQYLDTIWDENKV